MSTPLVLLSLLSPPFVSFVLGGGGINTLGLWQFHFVDSHHFLFEKVKCWPFSADMVHPSQSLTGMFQIPFVTPKRFLHTQRHHKIFHSELPFPPQDTQRGLTNKLIYSLNQLNVCCVKTSIFSSYLFLHLWSPNLYFFDPETYKNKCRLIALVKATLLPVCQFHLCPSAFF